VEGAAPAPDLIELDSALGDALRALSPADREALLLVAWEDLTPAQAARSLGINATAFRVRLLRARRRLQQKLADEHVARCEPRPNLDVETT
jgi:RNA polymerase sigma-70 factor (ECF subfamily)